MSGGRNRCLAPPPVLPNDCHSDLELVAQGVHRLAKAQALNEMLTKQVADLVVKQEYPGLVPMTSHQVRRAAG